MLFYVGNESPVEEYVNNTGLMWEYGKTAGSLLVWAEHRYEGESVPKIQGVDACMSFCTVEQALADYVSGGVETLDRLPSPAGGERRPLPRRASREPRAGGDHRLAQVGIRRGAVRRRRRQLRRHARLVVPHEARSPARDQDRGRPATFFSSTSVESHVLFLDERRAAARSVLKVLGQTRCADKPHERRP